MSVHPHDGAIHPQSTSLVDKIGLGSLWEVLVDTGFTYTAPRQVYTVNKTIVSVVFLFTISYSQPVVVPLFGRGRNFSHTGITRHHVTGAHLSLSASWRAFLRRLEHAEVPFLPQGAHISVPHTCPVRHDGFSGD